MLGPIFGFSKIDYIKTKITTVYYTDPALGHFHRL